MREILFCCLIFALVIFIIFIARKERYDSGEHVIAGNGNAALKYPTLMLHFPDNINLPTDLTKLPLSNGYELTFGEIIALSGDFYATLNAISDGPDRQTVFLEHFATLDNEKDGQAKKILAIIGQEIAMINKALKNGTLPSDGYEALGNTTNVEYNVATGGGSRVGSEVSKYFPNINIINIEPQGRMMYIADVNWDHFAYNGMSWNAYFAGHKLAMQVASLAGKTNNFDGLKRAYAMDAFACHYLSDHFAGGHLRTPRKMLHYGTSYYDVWSQTVGDYLSKLMHDEDNRLGVMVQNNACFNKNSKVSCNKWMAYGDAYMADPENAENLKMQFAALQQSIDEVWQSFVAKAPVKSTVYDYIPSINFENVQNRTPMFSYDSKSGKFYKRTPDGGKQVLEHQLVALYDFAIPDKNGKYNLNPYFK